MSKVKTKPLNEQTIVITGASSGIGLATSILAAVHGANVVLTSRNGTDLERIEKGITMSGGRALAVTADVTKEADLERVRDKALSKFGSIDTWVNNAGTSIYGYLVDTPLDEARKLFDVNFWGVVHGCKVALPTLAKKGGVIINLGSEVSVRSVPLQGMYSATKHAIKGYTDALRIETKKLGFPVGICLIRPTAINTPYPQHAVNHLRKGAPSLPTTMYDPDLVADAILKCAVSPQRDVFVGAPSRLHAIMDTLFPEISDSLMAWSAFEKQMKGKDHHPENEGLHRAPKTEGQIRGHTDENVKIDSAYTEVSMNPWMKAALLAAAVGTGFAISKTVGHSTEEYK